MLRTARGVLAVLLAIGAGSATLACGAKCKCGGDLGQAAIDATDESTSPEAGEVSFIDAPIEGGSATRDDGGAAPIAPGSTCACSSVAGGPCGQANGGCGCCVGTGLVCSGNNTCAGGYH